jgi:hypothetical protein
MTQRHDSQSQSKRLVRETSPASVGTVRALRERVNELEKRLETLEGNAHHHCSGCGGESYQSNGATAYMHDSDCSRT